MASVNHPNYRWQVGPADLIALQGCRLLEVFNGGPETNNAGRPGRPSHDALWDAVLSADRRLHAIAVDDAHYFKVFGRLLDSIAREFSIDANRLYVTGLSLGGFATWSMIGLFPTRFAAAVPMSGGGVPPYASAMIHTPIWNFHGQDDPTVSVGYSRRMIDAFKELGRMVVYTNCHNNDCTGLPDSVISMFVRSHADLLYTEYYRMGHPVWDISYDNPLLMEWVFDKYLQTPYAITITNPASYRVLRGVETVTWSSVNMADSVEIWYSPDAGGSWHMISRSEPNSGSYQWHTEKVSDGAFALLKIFVKNHEGFIYGHDQTGYLSVDNGVQGTPFVKILSDEFTTSAVFDQDELTLRYLLGDSRTMPVNVRLLGSPDGGLHFEPFDFYTAAVDSGPRVRTIDLSQLTNSDHEVIKLTVDNGTRTVSDQTFPFIKRTPRLSGPGSQHISGQGNGVVKVHIVDPSALTGDLYRVIINDTFLSYKFYDVVDVTRGHQVVSGATGLDGGTEGPLFDGIRLQVKDNNPASIDSAGTKWETGPSAPLNVTVVLPGSLPAVSSSRVLHTPPTTG